VSLHKAVLLSFFFSILIFIYKKEEWHHKVLLIDDGRYGKWFKNVNASLGAVIQGFLPALDNMALAPSAASALKSISTYYLIMINIVFVVYLY
jgi:hypothetical protein